MNRMITDWVLGTLKPESLEARSEACPDFLSDESAWSDALAFATRIHATLPFLQRVLESGWAAGGALPTPVAMKFEQRLSRERMLLAVLDQELDSALFLLLGAKIPVIVLKGMDLGRRIYPRRTLRPMTDVDLLVPDEAFHDSLRVLGRGGYRVSGPYPEGRIRVELSRRAGGPAVEMHRALLQGDNELKISGIWERSLEGAIPGLPRHARALSAEDTLAYLIRHGAVQHVLESPVWLNDLHYLLSSAEFREGRVDWDRIFWSLAEEKALSATYFVFQLLHSDWGTAVAPEALKKSAAEVGLLRRSALGRMARASAWFGPEERTRAWKIRSRFLLRDSAMEALRYGINRLL